MTDFLSLIGAIPSLISDFSGNTTAPYQKQQQQLAGQNQQISQALTQGPNNPLYQQIYGQYKQQNANNMASQIAEAQGQNRMNANMGRTPLFSNERGSENIFRTLMQQQQAGGVQADQQARSALQQAGSSGLQGIAGYNSITPSAIAANKGQNQGYQSIADMLRGFGIGQQSQTPQNNQAQPSYMGNANYASQMMPQSPQTGSMGAGNYTQQPQSYFNQMMRPPQPYGMSY